MRIFLTWKEKTYLGFRQTWLRGRPRCCFEEGTHVHGGKLGFDLFHLSANAPAATWKSRDEIVPSHEKTSMFAPPRLEAVLLGWTEFVIASLSIAAWRVLIDLTSGFLVVSFTFFLLAVQAHREHMLSFVV